MITIGIDPHKDTHTAAAVQDTSGEFIDELTIPATDAGAELLLAWAHRLAGEEELRFVLEDVRNVSGRLERFLLVRTEVVLRVGTRLMVGTRRSARTYGKSDSIDALAIARAALREPNLPRATHRPDLRELKLLSTTARTSSPSAPRSSRGCAGICTNSIPTWSPSHGP